MNKSEKEISFMDLIRIEFLKIRRAKLAWLLFAAPLLVTVSGVASLSRYFTPEYTSPWPAMFIQSALVYAYYLLPLSMIIVCVLLQSKETQNRGLQKMLSLPLSSSRLSLAKFCVLTVWMGLEILAFLIIFAAAGFLAIRMAGISEALPVFYLLGWGLKLFITMLPCLACMWALTVLLEKPLISAGLNLLLVIPGILAANTPLWIFYPYCYSGYLVSCSLHDFTAASSRTEFPWIRFLPCAAGIFLLALGVSLIRFGKKERR